MSTGTGPGHFHARRRSAGLLVLTLPMLILAALALPVGEARAVGACPSSQEFAVGGVGDTKSRFVPGASGATRIGYAASLAPVGHTAGDVSVARGEAALNRAARTFRARCPESAIHVTGYSMGALVAGNVRDSWNHDPLMRRNSSFTLIADPRADHGAMSRLPSIIPGFTHTGQRPFSTIPTSSVCRIGSDFICYVGDPTRNPLPLMTGLLGYLAGEHTYRSNEIPDSPGDHIVEGAALGATGLLLAVLLPQLPILGLLASLPAPEEVEPLLDVTQDLARAVAPELVPPAELSLVEYTPTPLRDYVPPPLAHFVPDAIGDVVLPALPATLTDVVELALELPGAVTSDSGAGAPLLSAAAAILDLVRPEGSGPETPYARVESVDAGGPAGNAPGVTSGT